MMVHQGGGGREEQDREKNRKKNVFVRTTNGSFNPGMLSLVERTRAALRGKPTRNRVRDQQCTKCGKKQQEDRKLLFMLWV